MTKQSGRVFYGWWIVALMFFTLFFTAGNGFYLFSVFVPRIIEELECDVFSVSIAAALWAVVFGFSSPLVGVAMQRFGPRKVLITATAVSGVVYVLMSMLTKLWHLYAINVLAGAAVAASTLVPAQTIVTLWFTKYRGRAMALTMMGIGLGGLLLPPFTAYLIGALGWRGTYRVIAVLTYVMVLPPLIFFLRNSPADVGQAPDGIDADGPGPAGAEKPAGVTVKRATRSATFWLLFGIYVLQLYTISAINLNTQVFAEHRGFTQMIAPLFMAFALGVTLPGRLITGLLCDRINLKYVVVLAAAFVAVSPLTLELCVVKLGWTDFRAIAIFSVFHGGAIAMNAIVLPVLVGHCFGGRNFSKIMGLVMGGFAIGVILGPTSAGKIFDKTGSYELAFVICTIAGVLSLILALLLRPGALHPEFETDTSPDVQVETQSA